MSMQFLLLKFELSFQVTAVLRDTLSKAAKPRKSYKNWSVLT